MKLELQTHDMAHSERKCDVVAVSVAGHAGFASRISYRNLGGVPYLPARLSSTSLLARLNHASALQRKKLPCLSHHNTNDGEKKTKDPEVGRKADPSDTSGPVIGAGNGIDRVIDAVARKITVQRCVDGEGSQVMQSPYFASGISFGLFCPTFSGVYVS